jgi:hypothetical protein
MVTLQREATRNSPHMLRAILSALALFCSGAATTAAQAESVVLQPNDRVRLSVSTPDLIRVLSGAPLSKKQLRREQFIGTLQGRRDDDVVIRVESPETELAIPVKSVTRLESSRGMHGCTTEGATTGIVAGAAGGVLLALVVCSSGDCDEDGRAMIATLFGGVGAIAGAAIGAITGSQMSCEHWHAVKIKDLPYGEGLPREDGIRLGLALPMPHH